MGAFLLFLFVNFVSDIIWLSKTFKKNIIKMLIPLHFWSFVFVTVQRPDRGNIPVSSHVLFPTV